MASQPSFTKRDRETSGSASVFPQKRERANWSVLWSDLIGLRFAVQIRFHSDTNR
jgi:hypothetical protein